MRALPQTESLIGEISQASENILRKRVGGMLEDLDKHGYREHKVVDGYWKAEAIS